MTSGTTWGHAHQLFVKSGKINITTVQFMPAVITPEHCRPCICRSLHHFSCFSGPNQAPDTARRGTANLNISSAAEVKMADNVAGLVKDLSLQEDPNVRNTT